MRHFRVERKEGSGRFEVYGAKWSFPSLAALVDYYGQHCVTAEGEVLRAPCPLLVGPEGILVGPEATLPQLLDSVDYSTTQFSFAICLG